MYKTNWIFLLFLAIFIIQGCSLTPKYPTSKTDKKEVEKKTPLPIPQKESEGKPPILKPPISEKENLKTSPLQLETQEELKAEEEPMKPSAPKVDRPLPPGNPAVVSLIEKSLQQLSKGLLTSAQNSLERAQRISPQYPEIYFQMANIRRRQGKFLEAAQLALKGVSVSAGYNSMLRRLWTLISQIRKEGGDLKGAESALEKAKSPE